MYTHPPDLHQAMVDLTPATHLRGEEMHTEGEQSRSQHTHFSCTSADNISTEQRGVGAGVSQRVRKSIDRAPQTHTSTHTSINLWMAEIILNKSCICS